MDGIKLEGWTFSADANSSIVSNLADRWPLSIKLICVLCKLALSAKSSCENPLFPL